MSVSSQFFNRNMDKLGNTIELKQKVANLRKQCNEYDSLLKHFSVQYIDLPLNMQKDLDERGRFKRKLGLYAMDFVFLSELYCINTAKNIEKKIAISRAKRTNEQIEQQLNQTNTDLTESRKFSERMRNEYKHVGDVQRILRDVNSEIESFVEKKIKLEENIKIDLDRILMKLEQLTD